MSDIRISLWDNNKKAEYTSKHESQTTELVAKSKGEHTAAKIDSVLASLSEEE